MTVTDMVVQGEVVRDIQPFTLPDSKTLKNKLDAIQHFQSLVQSNLIQDTDYGIIPGVKKPSLYQPGAEKIAKLLELAEYYDIEKIEDWDKGFFYYLIKCTLKMIGTDIVISTGLGSANSKEPKWAYRWVWPNEVPVGMDKTKMVSRKLKSGGYQYRLNNEEIYEIVNTILKIGKKRAFIDAVKSAGRLSNLFTQDIEDIGSIVEDNAEGKEEPPDEPKGELGNCPECKKPMVMKSGRYGEFLACSGYPQCQYKPPKDKSTPTDTPKEAPNPSKEPEKAVSGDSGDVPVIDKVAFETQKDALVLRLGWSRDLLVKHLKDKQLLTGNGIVTVANRPRILDELEAVCAKEGK
jgi:hypothetical protein